MTHLDNVWSDQKYSIRPGLYSEEMKKNFSASTRYIRLSVFSELFCWFQRQNFAPDWKTLPRHKKVGVKSTREEREEVSMYMCITVGPQLPCWLLPKIIEKIVTYCQFQVHHHENFQEKSWVNKFFLIPNIRFHKIWTKHTLLESLDNFYKCEMWTCNPLSCKLLLNTAT